VHCKQLRPEVIDNAFWTTLLMRELRAALASTSPNQTLKIFLTTQRHFFYNFKKKLTAFLCCGLDLTFFLLMADFVLFDRFLLSFSFCFVSESII
jgi:hypothetical protein